MRKTGFAFALLGLAIIDTTAEAQPRPVPLPRNMNPDEMVEVNVPAGTARMKAGRQRMTRRQFVESVAGEQIQVGPRGSGITQRNAGPPRQFQFGVRYAF